MKVAVLSDVHGNLQALEAVLDHVRGRVAETWCLGDVVGYGARPNECAALVWEACTTVLAGNHDLAAAGRVQIDVFTRDAARAIRWTREVLRPEVESWLRTLAPDTSRGDVRLVHGSPRDPVWEYVIDPASAEAALATATEQLVLCGHTHRPIAAWIAEGRLHGDRAAHGRLVELLGVRRTLLNVGSVGQPRDGDPRASVVLLELGADGAPLAAEFVRVAYDIEAAQRDIDDAGLPPQLADRLAVGA